MKRNLLRFGLLSLLLVFACIAKAQDVTAIWDFQKNLPEGINTATNFQGTTGDVNSTVEGITMHVDATAGKLKGRTSDAQFNTGTKLQIPVKSAKDVVTVTSYPNYHNYTIGGVAATADVTNHKATSAEVAQGYVEVIATGGCYLYQVKVVHVSSIQEKALYSTDFTNWEAIDRAKATDEVVKVKTLYSKEELSFTFNGVGVYPAGTNAKFPEITGFMQTAKYTGEYKAAEPSVVTSPLASITKITLHQAATGGKRGIKVSVKGDGDADWVAIHNVAIANAKGEDLTLDVNRTNCQIKFENFNLGQNAYVTDLAIYGNVDMSKSPMLGSFFLNGEKYHAADLFAEGASGKQVATVLISKKANLISETNPLTEIATDNGNIKSVTYATIGEGAEQKTVATIVVESNGDEATYELTVGFKPDFTLTYYDVDGKTVLGTQTVEQDAEIEKFLDGTTEKVTVADGKKFRGWASDQKKDSQKFTTSSVITESAALYALVTDIETASGTARYDYDLQKEGFDINDHEAIEVEGGKWHDATHGWTFNADSKVKVLMGGKGYIKMALCQYSGSGKIILSDPQGKEVASIDAKASKDGNSGILQNPSTESGFYTLSFEGTAYLHNLSIVNMTDPAFAQNGNWYTVKAGDAQSFITTLEVVNGENAAADAARSFIFLPNGTYNLGDQCLTNISGNNISLIGESMDKTIIVNKPAIENEGIGTTATLLNTGNNLYMQDITLQNALEYYKSGSAGRAVCLQDRGTQTICKNVKMLSYQDTYYSNEPNGKGQFYFEDSEIHGTVDYVCGGGDVYFNRVLFVNESRKEGVKNGEDVIAAPNSKSEWGYIFKDCTIENKAKAFSLGRSWNNITRLTWLNTTINQKDEILNDDKKYAYFTINAMGDAMADKFRLDVLKDAEGNVFSPAEKKVIFKNSDATKQKAEENIILTDEEAATFTLNAVFGDWRPETKAAQATATATTLKDGKLSWTGDAKMYLVAKDGKFYTLTTENTLAVDDDKASFTVRAANDMGGFGAATGSVSTGINSIMTTETAVAKTAIFAADGTQLSTLQKGINIVVKTMSDGSKKTSKIIIK